MTLGDFQTRKGKMQLPEDGRRQRKENGLSAKYDAKAGSRRRLR
jgi:hypothetical protein